MRVNYAYNVKNGEIFGYLEDVNFTTFPESMLIVYGNVILSKIPTLDLAKEVAEKYGYCQKCKIPKEVGRCPICNSKIIMQKNPNFRGIFQTW